MMGREGVSGGEVVEVIEGDTTAVFASVPDAVEDGEPTGVFVARTPTETWPRHRPRRVRRRR